MMPFWSRVEEQKVTPLFRDLIGLARLSVHRITRALKCVIDLLLIPLDDRQFLVVTINNIVSTFFLFGGQVNNLFLLL